jgi:hypothetical protein
MQSKYKEYKALIFRALQTGELTIEEVEEICAQAGWAIYGHKSLDTKTIEKHA